MTLEDKLRLKPGQTIAIAIDLLQVVSKGENT